MKNKHFLAMLAIPLAIAVISSGPISCKTASAGIRMTEDVPYVQNYPPDDEIMKVRAVEVFRSNVTYDYIPLTGAIEIHYLDKMYKTDDIFECDGRFYRIDGIEREYLGDYTISIADENTLYIRDVENLRLVGKVPLNNKSTIGRIILKDNQ